MVEDQDSKKDMRKIWYLIIIIIILVGGSAIFYYFNRDKASFISRPKNFTQTQTELAKDFVNAEPKLFSDTEIPEEVEQRFNDQLALMRQEIIDEEAKEDGNPYSGYLGVANTIRQLGDYQAAEQEYLKMIDKYPDDYLVMHNLGVLYEDMRQYLSAAESYTQSIKLKPSGALVHLKLARLYLKYSSNPDNVEGVFLKGLNDTNNDREIIKVYASYLESKQRYPEAILYWQEILKDNPDNQAVIERIAELEDKL